MPQVTRFDETPKARALLARLDRADFRLVRVARVPIDTVEWKPSVGDDNWRDHQQLEKLRLAFVGEQLGYTIESVLGSTERPQDYDAAKCAAFYADLDLQPTVHEAIEAEWARRDEAREQGRAA